MSFPGFPFGAGSFVDSVLNSPRVVGMEVVQATSAPAALEELMQRSGLQVQTATEPVQIDDDLLASIDLAFDRLLPAEAGVDAAHRPWIDDLQRQRLIVYQRDCASA